jgi:hypothetical protein
VKFLPVASIPIAQRNYNIPNALGDTYADFLAVREMLTRLSKENFRARL